MTRRFVTTILDLREIGILLSAGERLGGPQGVTLELAITTAALPFEITQIELASIDWRNGIVEVGDRIGGRRQIALSYAAQTSILRAAGSARARGQAVTGGRGEPIKAPAMRIDRFRDVLAASSPDTITLDWSWHSLRRSIAAVLAEDGRSSSDIEALLGTRTSSVRRTAPTVFMAQAIATATRWATLLGRDAETPRGPPSGGKTQSRGRA